jgi:hypothetical protein
MNDRFKKRLSETRRDRAMEDRRVTEDRQISEDDRLEQFRKSFFQAALPDLPKIPGYRTCWLTTNNPKDSIASRMRLGYEPVKESDVPGWDHASIKTGEWAGCIGVNEMLAFKIPEDLWKAYMTEWHHTQPRDEEERIADTRKFIDEARAAGVRQTPVIYEGGGQAELRQTPPRPQFD